MARSAIVVGAGIGGLSAAIHARLKGYDVLVLEGRDGPGGKARQVHEGGYRFDPGPSIVILTEIYDILFATAGRRREDYLQFQRLDPFSRVHFEGRPPLDLPADLESCRQVLKSEFPEDLAGFDFLIQEVGATVEGMEKTIFRRPIDQPWHMASPAMAKFAQKAGALTPFKQIADKLFSSDVLRAFFYGFPSYSGQSYRSPSPGSLLIPYYMIQRGVFWPVGGIAAIPDALYRLAVELGIEFRFGQKVTEWIGEGKRLGGVRTESGETHRADAYISNQDRITTRQRLGLTPPRKPSYSYFTIHWGIRGRMEGLSHHTLLVPKTFAQGFEELYTDRRFPTRPIVYLNETTGIDPSTAPAGCTNLFAVITCPAREDHLDWETLRDEARERTLAEMRLHGFDPGDIEVERIQTPLTFESRDNNFRGTLYGADETERLWGFMPLRCRDEDFKNLFYAGGSVQPGAGMPMVALSGKFAASYLP